MLWHVFRYRDGRQQTANRSSSRDIASDEEVSSTTTANAVTITGVRPGPCVPGMARA